MSISSRTSTPLPAVYRLGSRIYRLLQIIILSVLAFAVIYGWNWLSDPAEFPIKSIKVQAGYEHIDKRALQNKVLPYVESGFIRFRAAALKQELMELPWVANVDIQRIWPDTIVIKLAEQQAVARWGELGLLNAKGEVFTPPPDTLPDDLPVLNGSQDQAMMLWNTYREASQALAPLKLTITELNMDQRQSLRLGLANGMQLFLGKKDPLLRLQRFVKVYPKIFTSPGAQAEYVDLRYENGVSVKWRDNAHTGN